MVQCLGWNQPRTAATPSPARGSTSSRTWGKSNRAACYGCFLISAVGDSHSCETLFSPPPASHQWSLSQQFTGSSESVTLSASSWISTTDFSLPPPRVIKLWTGQVGPTHSWVFIMASSLCSLSCLITGQRTNYQRQKEIFFLGSQLCVHHGKHDRLLTLCLLKSLYTKINVLATEE